MGECASKLSLGNLTNMIGALTGGHSNTINKTEFNVSESNTLTNGKNVIIPVN